MNNTVCISVDRMEGEKYATAKLSTAVIAQVSS
jgi:hypothetical protein